MVDLRILDCNEIFIMNNMIDYSNHFLTITNICSSCLALFSKLEINEINQINGALEDGPINTKLIHPYTITGEKKIQSRRYLNNNFCPNFGLTHLCHTCLWMTPYMFFFLISGWTLEVWFKGLAF